MKALEIYNEELISHCGTSDDITVYEHNGEVLVLNYNFHCGYVGLKSPQGEIFFQGDDMCVLNQIDGFRRCKDIHDVCVRLSCPRKRAALVKHLSQLIEG